MRNLGLIIKHEILITLGKRSFWIMTFVFPILVLTLSVSMQTLGTNAIIEAEETASTIEGSSTGTPVGYVDESGVLDTSPPWVPSGYMESFPSIDTVKAALDAGIINQYYYIPENFYETGEFVLVDRDFQPLRSSSNAEVFKNILSDALIEQDPLGVILKNPISKINGHAIGPPPKIDQDDTFSYVVPLAIMFIFFFTITSSSGFMLNSVTREKENRTAEILLISLEPKQLMTGKIIGLGVVALFQMAVWMGGSLTALNNSDKIFAAARNFELPNGFIVYAFLFFIFGYFLYASILGAIGVLAPNAREGGQFSFIAVFPLLVPLWFNYSFSESPDGPLTLFLSLFPFTAPPSMITRLTLSSVPIWQILASLAGLAITAYIFIFLASRLFRADTLLSSESFRLNRLVKEIRKK
jgi:ABC-2 type transport system permease protein